ncbi:MAG: hypothetical protein A07HB70_00589 [uncultured archaeon A07HB70]|jgi:hypothetical protein|nr:MAG: hypothetical protein A07HB70_00589 [uncultured archaeon A07HB70]
MALVEYADLSNAVVTGTVVWQLGLLVLLLLSAIAADRRP